MLILQQIEVLQSEVIEGFRNDLVPEIIRTNVDGNCRFAQQLKTRLHSGNREEAMADFDNEGYSERDQDVKTDRQR